MRNNNREKLKVQGYRHIIEDLENNNNRNDFNMSKSIKTNMSYNNTAQQQDEKDFSKNFSNLSMKSTSKVQGFKMRVPFIKSPESENLMRTKMTNLPISVFQNANRGSKSNHCLLYNLQYRHKK